MTTYPVRVSPDGLDVAVRSNDRGILSETAPWRASGGMALSDAQVADWLPYAPAPQPDIDTRSAIGRVAEFAEHFAIDHAKHDEIVDVSHKRVLRLTDLDRVLAAAKSGSQPESEDTGPVGAAAAQTFDAWRATYPPRAGRDPDVSKIPAILAGLSADELEILALSARNLCDIAWDVRRDKLRAEARHRHGITTARVSLMRGKLIAASTVTIDGQTAPVPTHVEPTGPLFPPRVIAAIEALGYTVINGMRVSGESDVRALAWVEYDVMRKAADNG